MPAAFLNPWMLAALAAVSIPLIIELLHRRRRRIIRFPAMRYLLESEKQKKVRLQDLILLLLRSFLIFVLVLALARPILRAGSALWAGGADRDVVLVFDGTYSAGQRVGATSAFEVGKKMADQVLRSMGRSPPRITVVFLGHKAEFVCERSRDLSEVRGLVERLRVSDGSARVSEALDLVRDFVEREGIQGAEIYIVSDLQRITWTKRAASGAAGKTAALLSGLSAKCRLFVLDAGAGPRGAGGAERTNCYLTRFEPRERVLAAGVPVSFDVQVEGRGPRAAGGSVLLTLYVNGQKRGEKEVEMRPSASGAASAQAVFTHTFGQGGEYFLKLVLELVAREGGDPLPVDDNRYYLCRVPEAVKVLIFDEAPDGGTRGRGGSETRPYSVPPASWYLRRAIAPERWPGFDKFTVFECAVRRPAEIAREDLHACAVVVLAGVKDLTESFAARLHPYVREGGRLLVFLGEGVEPYAYNRMLFRDGAGVLPARLAGGVQEAPEPGLFLSSGLPLHEALAHFKGRPKVTAGFEDLQVQRYIPIEVGKEEARPLEPPAATVMRLGPGGREKDTIASHLPPVVVERRIGRGLACLVSTSVDGRWGDLPYSRDFPVLIQELLRHMVGDPDRSVNLSVDDPFEQQVMTSRGHLILTRPDGRKVRVTPRKSEGGREWRLSFKDTDRQGLYRFVGTNPETLDRRQFIVNLVPEEGDLAAFGAEQFKSRFGVRGLELLDSVSQVRRTVEALHSKKELAIALLWILFVLLFVETYLAKRFGMRRV